MQVKAQCVIEFETDMAAPPQRIADWITHTLAAAPCEDFPKPVFSSDRAIVRPARDDPTMAQMRADAATVQETLGPMFDLFKAQCLLALIVRQPNKQVTISAKEIDRMGEWIATMDVDQIKGEFTMKAQKKS